MCVKDRVFVLLVVLMVLHCSIASAHPASGIVVDSQGQVFFAETGDPDTGFPGVIWKIDAQGKSASFHTIGAHWLALDADGSFGRAELDKWFQQRNAPNFERLTPVGSDVGLLGTDGAPFAIQEGNLYYGNIEITRLSPDAKKALLVTNLKDTVTKLDGIKGLAAGPDHSIYVATPSAVLKIKLDGTLSTLVHPIVLKDCDSFLPAGIRAPGLRGLAVDEHGNVYAAASGCRCLLEITPAGQIHTILKSEGPWSPTGVALHDGNVYVLEYSNPNSKNRADWSPRVRILGPGGRVHTLATVEHNTNHGNIGR
jgi:hypothetical protein